MKIKQLFPLLVLLMLIGMWASGCGNAEHDTSQQQYPDDGYMGLSSSNPGILTSPNSRTYSNDAALADLALQDIPHIRRKTVQFEGGTVIVRIKVDESLNEDEVAALRMEAKERLAAMMPRYEVRVRTSQ